MTAVALFAVLLFASPVISAPATNAMNEIDQSIAMGRLDQARHMIVAAVAAGATGEVVDRPLAALAVAAGRHDEALVRLQALLIARPDDPQLNEQAILAAMRSGKRAVAARLVEVASRHKDASWRVWNAKAVLADDAREWDASDMAYARASALAPLEPAIANNIGWSMLLRGDWARAAPALARAAALDPHSPRIANNYDLARTGLAGDLPSRREAETSAAYAARLNDAGMAAEATGDVRRARAAFARAIETSGHYYARADANLARVEGRE